MYRQKVALLNIGCLVVRKRRISASFLLVEVKMEHNKEKFHFG